MELSDLRLENLRIFAEQTIALEPGWNAFVGGNGAGKTTILEAVYLLSHGRSFRANAREALLREHAQAFGVSASVCRRGAGTRVGIGIAGRAVEARIDGKCVAVAELMYRVATVCFEPGSHAIISGAADVRRRFLDWGLFHVEPTFLGVWRRYSRALKQRNAALRSACSNDELDVWDHELAAAAAPLMALRRRYCAALNGPVIEELDTVLAELGTARFNLFDGVRAGVELHDVLKNRRSRDRGAGYTSAGPHRTDWALSLDHASTHQHLSRGQAKLAAFACVMAQLRVHESYHGDYPVVCLDDLASELDGEHHKRVSERLRLLDAQILVTASSERGAFAPSVKPTAMFHVEHGRVQKML